MLLNVEGTPYYLANGAGTRAIQSTIRELTERVELLRTQGKLTDSTLHEYYGEKRFEQIAESNALEGSTLSVGETELAVLKGITVSGHDPGFSRDAQALARALDKLAEMARIKVPTDIEQVKLLHELILGGRPTAGVFRAGEVRIRGSKHVPPRTWPEIMGQMEQWQAWSRNNADAPTLLRASVLHAWLEHIHPFQDGNGRTGRAVTNLELVRAGYPPIILRRKDRDQYLDALGRADEGDLGALIDLMAGRTEDALRDLERVAQRTQGYDLQRERLRRAQSNRLALWNAGVHLLFAGIRSNLADRFGDRLDGRGVEMREYDPLSVEDFIDLCEGRFVRLSWAFTIRCHVPGMPRIELLAWASVMDEALRARLAQEPGRPALMWSVPNPVGYPPWTRAGNVSPGGEQMTIHRDRWIVVRDGKLLELSPSELAAKIAEDIAERAIPPGTL
ncbi:MAG TPA: Fic family protein [Thermoanaerobaculia bacterium]|jgi:Fic family protein|nr:Fic family protein [Thermoanaerobaculia bacterium]